MCRWLLRWSMTMLATVLPAVAAAQQVPLALYSTANGLANNWVNRIVADSRGFLWFCTREGLSRYDGYQFTNYGTADGLPSAIVHNVLETRDGTYWVATSRGLARFHPAGVDRKKFTTILPSTDQRSHDVRALYEDRAGRVWVGTLGGLFSVQPDRGGVILYPLVPIGTPEVVSLTEDRTGTLWAGASVGLHRIAAGRVDRLMKKDGLPGEFISDLVTDSHGRIWIATREGGLAMLEIDPDSGRGTITRRIGTREGLPSGRVNRILLRPDGGLWAATSGGLAEIQPNGAGYRIRTLDRRHGLPATNLETVGEDRRRSVWIGTESGAANLSHLEFAIFGPAEGVNAATTLLETPSGDVLVAEASGAGYRVLRLDNDQFESVEIAATRAPAASGSNQTFLIDRGGDYWIGSRKGLLRYRGVRAIRDLAHTSPVATYDGRAGLPADVVMRVFEDSRGDIWVSTTEGKSNGVSRWQRATNRWHHWTGSDELPLDRFIVSAFAEDRHGNVWLGLTGDAGLARFRDGKWTRFTAAQGVPGGRIPNLLVDSRGRLWVATMGGGLAVTDAPADERPVFRTYTTAQGLSSDSVTAVVEGDHGHVYAGTGRGLDRLDPATGHVTAIATAGAGFPLGVMQAALRSRTGAYWFSFLSGLVRYTPAGNGSPVTPSMLISNVDVSGERVPLSALGQTELPRIELAAGRTLHVEFGSPGVDAADRLRYQTKLDGGDGRWSEPSDRRRVTFANLSPGSYRFAVRATGAAGVGSPEAGFRFVVLAPIWRRWWFLTLMVAAVAATAHSLYRRRMARLLEIARMRARIATDLHDDIGANLTRIAVLSEVARQQPDVVANGQKLDSQLASIAAVARESMTAMSDIVWAISPERDDADELVRRMREYAGEVCPDIALTFSGPDGARASRLGPDARREVYLIFKEAMNNVARHAGATAVDVRLVINAGGLVLDVRDNGIGFESGMPNDGNGLVSIRRRADRLGARLTVTSAPGSGTAIHLDVPAAHLRQDRPRIS